MESLSDKLKSLGVKVGAQSVPRPKPRQDYSIDKVIPGQIHTTHYGDAFLVEHFYPQDYQHGSALLCSPAPLGMLTEWAQMQHLADTELGQFVFLDTETTGLAGGTGTYAFMIGIGRFTEGGFQVIQFFMRDPTEEPALLAALTDLLNPCQAIVTFNGKSFDAPLLNTRYTLQGFESPVQTLPDLDLLPLARRLWRDRLPSRALSYLEVSILGAYRTEEEVPGWMIPQMYFDYLRSGDARPMRSVFYHNAMDIVSLASLFNHTARMLADPLQADIPEGLDLVDMARLFEDLGHIDLAIETYQKGLKFGLPENFFWDTIQRLSFVYRRQGDYQAALNLWEKAAEHGQYYAHIELAKFYEHELRDIDRALRWTEAALDLVGKPTFPAYQRRQLLPELEHRLARLKRKAGVG